MPFLSERDQTLLRDIFEKQMVNDVTITLFTQREVRLVVPGFEEQTSRCAEANQVMDELSALSDKIKLEVYDFRVDAATLLEHHVQRIPAAILGSNGARPARFIGVPGGYEFSTLVQDILDLSTNNVELLPQTQNEIKALEEDVHIQVFVTPT